MSQFLCMASWFDKTHQKEAWPRTTRHAFSTSTRSVFPAAAAAARNVYSAAAAATTTAIFIHSTTTRRVFSAAAELPSFVEPYYSLRWWYYLGLTMLQERKWLHRKSLELEVTEVIACACAFFFLLEQCKM